ncbi:MAG: carbohydrate ABC transporter permease [Firmicutes bacterium]|jgi:multiple sugar transport system permease protein|nr:carbohydrate ABC transporter permease [Bacillota bacterium]
MPKSVQLIGRILLYALVFLILFGYLFPLFWQFSTSLKHLDEVFRGLTLIPAKPMWENYRTAWSNFNVGKYLLNTVIVACAITLGQVISCSMAGYGFARLRFPGRDAIFYLYLGTMMIPSTVTLIPAYIIVLELGLVDSLQGLILPFVFGNALGTFLVRQYLMSIPNDLEDAAKIDGAGYFTIWTRVMLPMSKPALATTAVMTLVAQWNSLVWPLIVIQSDRWKVLSVGLADFRLFRNVQWNTMMAAVVMATLPMIIILFLAQRFFIQGIQFSGMNK